MTGEPAPPTGARSSINLRGHSLYDRVGGEAWFRALVDRFYEGVESDPLLRPLYPDDLTESKDHLALFLMQYWGGPSTYSDQRGHPRLRMRHVPFAIGQAEAEAWYRHMAAAVAGGGADPADEAQLLDYFRKAADFLVNRPS